MNWLYRLRSVIERLSDPNSAFSRKERAQTFGSYDEGNGNESGALDLKR